MAKKGVLDGLHYLRYLEFAIRYSSPHTVRTGSSLPIRNSAASRCLARASMLYVPAISVAGTMKTAWAGLFFYTTGTSVSPPAAARK